MSTSWSVSLDLTRWKDFDQNTAQTTDGRPSEDAANLCGQTCCADGLFYLTGVTKLPDEVHDEGWGQGYLGISSAQQVQAYLQKWNGIPSRIFTPTTAQATAHLLWQQLYWRKFACYLVTFGGIPHWVVALGMSGGDTADPFTSMTRANPWDGIRETQTWDTWRNVLRTDTNGLYLVLTLDRLPGVLTPDLLLGPTP